MNLLSITPDAFQTTALAWVGALTVIVSAIAVAIPVLVSKLATAKEALNQLGKRVSDHSVRIQDNSTEITKVALQVAPEVQITQKP